MRIVFDMDGTLADLTHRRHFVEKKPKDWGAFFAACSEDTPHLHALAVLEALKRDHDVEVWSGRPERCRADTEEWFLRWMLWVPPLRMRADGDFRADDIVKEEFLAKYGWPDLIFDDRDRVVAMWRRNGIPCFQVAEGAF